MLTLLTGGAKPLPLPPLQLTAGLPTDALLFGMPPEGPEPKGAADKLKRRMLRGSTGGGRKDEDLMRDSVSSINEMGLHAGACECAGAHVAVGWVG